MNAHEVRRYSSVFPRLDVYELGAVVLLDQRGIQRPGEFLGSTCRSLAAGLQ
jgi:hypothetical protein